MKRWKMINNKLATIYECCEKIKRREVMESDSLDFADMVDKYMNRIQAIVKGIDNEENKYIRKK